MSENRERPVHSLLIPLHQMTLLLPNASVAEIIGYTEPEAEADMPDWMMGTILWRGFKVPLVSYEAMLGMEQGGIKGRVRIAILNGIGKDSALPFYAVVTQGIPRLLQATKNMVAEADELHNDSGLVLASVRVRDEEALIPDMDAIESRITDTLHGMTPVTG